MLVSVRTFASAAILLGVLLIVASAVANSTNFDFRAFYCAGASVRQHASPYHTEPLHTCEWNGTDNKLAAFSRQIIVPAPQPGYDMAAFAMISYLPFTVATRVWTLILLLSCIATVLAVQRLCNLPITLVTITLWLSLIVPSIFLGELIPLCVAAVAMAALCAKSERWPLAGLCAAASVVEPHIGFPVCAAMLFWAPRARPAILASLLALAAVALITLGTQPNLEYLTTVLPAHALSEIASDAQLSASVALHWLGVSDGLALRLGTLSYLGIVAAAIYLARAVAKRFSDDSLLVTLPAAFAVMGGIFIHVTETTLAIPLLLTLIRHLGSRASFARAGVVLLAVPWWSIATPMLLTPDTALAMVGVTITYLVWRLSNENAAIAVCSGACAALAAGGLVHWHALLSVPYTSINPPAAVFASTYPEANWGWINTKYMSTGSPPTWLLRALTWTGLLCAASQSLLCAVRWNEKRLTRVTAAPAAGALSK